MILQLAKFSMFMLGVIKITGNHPKQKFDNLEKYVVSTKIYYNQKIAVPFDKLALEKASTLGEGGM